MYANQILVMLLPNSIYFKTKKYCHGVSFKILKDSDKDSHIFWSKSKQTQDFLKKVILLSKNGSKIQS